MSGIHFYNTKEKYFITTNFKVMYSNLNTQPHLKEVRTYQVFINLMLKKWGLGRKHYFLIRPVEKRLESFYKNKFKRWRPKLSTLPKEEWQRSLKIFFPYLNINLDSPTQKIQEQLKEVDFNKMVSVLENVIDEDGHIRPQTAALHIYFLKRFHHLELDAIYNIDAADYPEIMKNVLKLDLGIVSNRSGKASQKLEWSEESKEIVKRLYSEDYALFAPYL